MKIVGDFFDKEQLDWDKLAGVCTDGAPAMLGCRSGFVEVVKKKNPQVEATHCFIHREALASKTLTQPLKDHLSNAIKVVNYIKGSALNTRLFDKLCRDLDALHSSLLFHTEVRWLSKGNMLMRFFELRSEVLQFLKGKTKNNLFSAMTADDFEFSIAYLADIFGLLNELNRKLQGQNKNVLTCCDNINAFKAKLRLWKSRMSRQNTVSFPLLHSLLADESIPNNLMKSIMEHLTSLIDEFQKYFPPITTEKEQLINMTKDPFLQNAEQVPEEFQEEFLELINNSSMKDEFRRTAVENFWIFAGTLYPKTSHAALKILIPFSSTYLCESGFSSMLTIKSEKRNRLNVEADLRCALSNASPNISVLVNNKQQQKSH
jgi:hypothetical protein